MPVSDVKTGNLIYATDTLLSTWDVARPHGVIFKTEMRDGDLYALACWRTSSARAKIAWDKFMWRRRTRHKSRPSRYWRFIDPTRFIINYGRHGVCLNTRELK